MIDIIECELEGQVSETPIFEVKGTYYDDDFHCKVELRFDGFEDDDFDYENDVDYENIEGPDLGPAGFDALEDLINEVFETEAYLEALEEFQKIKDDLAALFD